MPLSWSGLKRFYGFAKPYDFNVAIPALLNIPFLLLFLIKLYGSLLRNGRAHLEGNLGQFGPYAIYEIYFFYIYVFAGFILFNIFIRKRKIYYPLFIWFSIELCLGVWGLMPMDSKTVLVHPYDYHPLLQGSPIPDFRGRNRDLSIAHNSLGMRDTGNSPRDVTREGLIFVYGGSTTYDIQVSQGFTWVETLNKLLGNSYKLFNLGVPGYSTSEHVIQTAFYSDINGVYPSCAIYYIGWNDTRNSYISGLDRAYADYGLISQPGNLATRRSMNLLTVSPLLKLFLKTASYFVDTVPYPNPKLDESPAGKANLPLKAIFERNVATIAAINKSRQVKTIVIAQILNKEKLEKPERVSQKMSASAGNWNAYMPFLTSGDSLRVQAEFNDLLKANADKVGYTFIDADIDKFSGSDFVDSGHFSASGAAKFAHRIAEQVRLACPLS